MFGLDQERGHGSYSLQPTGSSSFTGGPPLNALDGEEEEEEEEKRRSTLPSAPPYQYEGSAMDEIYGSTTTSLPPNSTQTRVLPPLTPEQRERNSHAAGRDTPVSAISDAMETQPLDLSSAEALPPSYMEASASHSSKMSTFLYPMPRSFSRVAVQEEAEPLSALTNLSERAPRSSSMVEPPNIGPLFEIKQVHVAPLAKFYLFFSNFLATIMGLGVVSVGAYSSITQGTFTDLSGFGTDPAALLIALGCFILFLGGCGLVGSLRENCTLLKIFHITLLVLLLCQLVAGLLLYFLQAKVKDAAAVEVVGAIKKYQTSPLPTALDDAIIQVQLRFQCCGANSARDWRDNSPYFPCSSQEVSETLFSACSVPASCCQNDALTNAQCGYKVFAYPNMTQSDIAKYPRISDRDTIIWNTGCVNALYDWLRSNWVTLAVVSGVILLLEVLGVEAARKLIDSLKIIKKVGFLKH